jgi:hypothetical protein
MRMLRSYDLLALWLPGAALAVMWIIIIGKVMLTPPEHDEAELLHASWLMAHGGTIWIDFFEHHSPLYLKINSWLLQPDSVFYVLYAKLFAMLIYALGAFLFAAASYLWLNVEREFRLPFLLFAQAAYIALTWPCAVGMVRPEDYAMPAVMAGSVSGYCVGTTRPPWCYVFSFVCSFFLVLAVAFSPRTLVLVCAAVLLIVWTLRAHQARVRLGAMAFLGAGVVVLLNLATAPLFGFHLWLIDFNGHLRPIRRALPPSSYGSIAVAFFLMAVGGGWLIATLAPRSSGRLKGIVCGDPAPPLPMIGDRRLFLAQILIALSWIYLFADNSWGPQSPAGIAVASSAGVAVVLAGAIRIRSWARLQADGAIERMGPAAPAAAVVLMLVAAGALSIDKIVAIGLRLHPAGMARDISLMLHDQPIRLGAADELPSLATTRNLGEWLLWSRRECELFRNDRVLAIPTRHQVCVRDASFYWYGGVHIRAMEQDKVGFVPWPPYRVREDILTTRPAFIESAFLTDNVLPDAEVERMLERDYAFIQWGELGGSAWLRKDLLRAGP